MANKTEAWQRGPVENVPGLLQPVAHALLQAREEVSEIMNGFPENFLWEKPAGCASPGFHLQHITGVLDRLFTYARNESLTNDQVYTLSVEGNKEKSLQPMHQLIELFNNQVTASINELSKTNIETLTDVRTVGRKKIPSTLIGLYFHAAEHVMRHIGQLLVNCKSS